MAAPITTEQSGDLLIYKDTLQYLTNILSQNIPLLTPANVTKLNDDIGAVLDNVAAIVAEATPAP